MGYYKYSKEHPEFPFSYYVAAFKDVSLLASLIMRISYHIDDFGIGINYTSQKKTRTTKHINTWSYSRNFYRE